MVGGSCLGIDEHKRISRRQQFIIIINLVKLNY